VSVLYTHFKCHLSHSFISYWLIERERGFLLAVSQYDVFGSCNGNIMNAPAASLSESEMWQELLYLHVANGLLDIILNLLP
jgi:hypothetical protein